MNIKKDSALYLLLRSQGREARLSEWHALIVSFYLNSGYRHLNSPMLSRVSHEVNLTRLESFYEEGVHAVDDSSFPLATCLRLIEFIQFLSDNDTSQKSKFDQMEERFNKLALDLWKRVSYYACDDQAQFILERSIDINGTCVLDMALRCNCFDLINHPRVGRIVQNWWRPYSFWRSRLREYFLAPATKFYLDVMSFLTLLVLF